MTRFFGLVRPVHGPAEAYPFHFANRRHIATAGWLRILDGRVQRADPTAVLGRAGNEWRDVALRLTEMGDIYLDEDGDERQIILNIRGLQKISDHLMDARS